MNYTLESLDAADNTSIVLESVELNLDEQEAVRGVLDMKEKALEFDVLVPNARLDNLLADRYDTSASHPWRKRASPEEVDDQFDALSRSCFVTGGKIRSEA